MSAIEPGQVKPTGELREYIPESRPLSFAMASRAVWHIVHHPAGWSIQPYRAFTKGDWVMMTCVTVALLGALAVVAWGIGPAMGTPPLLVLAIGSVPMFIGLVAIWGAKVHSTHAQKSTPDLVRWNQGSDRIEFPRLRSEVEIHRLLAVEIATVSQSAGSETYTSRRLVLHLLDPEGLPSNLVLGRDEWGLTRAGKFIGRELRIPVIRRKYSVPPA